MTKGKKSRTKEDSILQKHRTAKNQIRRYSSLIEENPNSRDIKAWQSKLAKREAVLK